MKTAEEWNDILDEKYRNGERQTDADQVAVIKQIQLDAYRAGGLAAAKIAEQNKGKSKQERLESKRGLGYYTAETMEKIRTEENGENIASHNIQQAILTHFNNLKLEIPAITKEMKGRE